MNIRELVAALRLHPEAPLALQLPDGSWVPAHFHITEVGHVTKRFVDCGGTRRIQETCLLQTWVHDDFEHRLLAGKLADIFAKAGDLLPHEELPVEVEHEGQFVAQFPLESAAMHEGSLRFQLGLKHTDCLARGICLPNTCQPKPQSPPTPLWQVRLASAPSQTTCSPSSGCC